MTRGTTLGGGELSRRARITVVPAMMIAVGAALGAAQATRSASRDGWKVPPSAASETSPFTATASVLAAGKKVYSSKCQRCHGASGKGDGQDAEKKYQKDMDLTVAARAADNPDGVVFYKVWNGRTNPKMPVFSEELSKEQVWAVVAYVQSLRARQP